ncbi:DEAD/DEAH box helicase [Neolewinella aurantiaca]|uniref:DEAD/DEAH box helicase n=1 Tax=Neolewinella aurantiaca TaxID=2602767 RepID=UPI001FEBC247|nr:type ISP restriction/modification enzyme [Neolewinella aurantiaca]
MQESAVDWRKLQDGLVGTDARKTKYKLREHQQNASDKTHKHLQTHDRGKLIMACGTGKTFTSLRIAERETNHSGLVLFLVPSIALLGQTLREWAAQAIEPINAVCICSDPKITKDSKKKDAVTATVVDLALPASTDVKKIVKQLRDIRTETDKGMSVVFSTYQSIQVIADAQRELLKVTDGDFGVFDLIICDEAHRTTGAKDLEAEASAFVRVHDNDFIQANKRIYMTATPRLYSDDSKAKAAQNEATVWSMDDETIFGEEMYRIGFGEAVERNLLTDYKVLVLTLSDQDVPEVVQRAISNEESEISFDDASKLVGCINALSKQLIGDKGSLTKTDPDPMRRAVAFCQNIKVSKRITNNFNETTELYIEDMPDRQREKMAGVHSQHIDGSMSATERDELMSWLKADPDDGECRVLTNVRCLSEGVDVPSLDAVMFLTARNSQVDVVQSVGRVMRRAEGKKYGYIIIPVVIPSDVEPDKALNDNARFAVVWTVLNALRAHDDRFNATVNKIDLNKQKPDQIIIGRPDNGESGDYGDNAMDAARDRLGQQLAMQFEALQEMVYAKLVTKVGTRTYWETWAKEIAEIAQKQTARIRRLVQAEGTHRKAFINFLAGLRQNINPAIGEEQAIEMLSQHIITKPVFEALFEGHSFVSNNPISVSMQKMLDALEEQAIEEDSAKLDAFYASVRNRAAGIDNAEGKQKIIVELYDKFFATAFPKMVEQLGIVYTPTEVVDFTIRSVNDLLQQEFGLGLTDENVHILDPFTGTGTFITRLLQSGLIEQKDLARKYKYELHANEIVLLAYYIAAVNIESTYHDLAPGEDGYVPFDGIVLTDTFQLGEPDADSALISESFPQNSERVKAQKGQPIRVIMGNPPYSVGQKSANDNAQNQKYEVLDSRIANTYAFRANSTNLNSLYDSYIKAFRWASDRLDKNTPGIIGFVTNGAWIDGGSQSGFRETLIEEFSSIYVFNLRGNQRTSGELSRKEGGKIFGSGSRTPITITFLVKDPTKADQPATVNYHDIGDYLSREEKLSIIDDFGSVAAPEMKWTVLKPDEHGDWLNQRNTNFEEFIPIGDKDDKKNRKTFFMPIYTRGVATARDAWCYNSSKDSLKKNVKKTIDFYNEQRKKYHDQTSVKQISPKAFVSYDNKSISWNRGFLNNLKRNHEFSFLKERLYVGVYRPFFKQNSYFSKDLNDMVYQVPKSFPNNVIRNTVLACSGVGVTKRFTSLLVDTLPDLEIVGKSQCFPLHYYTESAAQAGELFASQEKTKYTRHDGITDWIHKKAQAQYGTNVSKEDIFYYVYGFLHSPEYRTTFENDLKKSLPRLPLVDSREDFWKFSNVGRELGELHVNYESVPANAEVKVVGEESGNFRVQKMKFIKKGEKHTIIYNSSIKLENIPAKAYEYIVNGKSAIEWIMERYQVKTDKKSGIKNDPNDWAEEVGNPRYILDLLLSVVEVSVRTVDIVASLPKVDFDE